MKTGPAGRSLWLPSLGSGIPASRFPTVETILDFAILGHNNFWPLLPLSISKLGYGEIVGNSRNSRPLIRLDSVGSVGSDRDFHKPGGLTRIAPAVEQPGGK